MHTERTQSSSNFPKVSVTACASENQVGGALQKSSMVVPVYLSHEDNPGKERLYYAMIDSQSDISFVTEGAARALGLEGKEIRLSLSTMTASNKVINCRRFSGLKVRGYNSTDSVELPPVYSRKSIPINRSHILCSDMIRDWPHLESLRDKLVPKLQCDVGLLIGYDCPSAQFPEKVLSGAKGGPFGQKSILGWGIVGVINSSVSTGMDAIGCSHRIVASPESGSQIVIQKRITEIVSPAECLKVMESDFSDRICNEESSSLDERAFLRAMEEGLSVDSSGHYSMPLPFNREKGRLFNNRGLVINRAMSLKRKLMKDAGYRQEYTAFMEDMMDRSFAEEDSDDMIKQGVWYIPHFGVFHKTKGKIRVVFDCAARYGGVSLNVYTEMFSILCWALYADFGSFPSPFAATWKKCSMRSTSNPLTETTCASCGGRKATSPGL